MIEKNITRYTYDTTTFQGWRLSICRKWTLFTKYFPDRKYGSEEAAYKAALEMREQVLEALKNSKEDPRVVFDRFKDSLKEEAFAAQ